MQLLAPIHGTPYVGGQTPALLYVSAADVVDGVFWLPRIVGHEEAA